ncbi:MAG: hypothetical protein ACOH2R_19875 [Pseudomonas sp.]
MLQGLSRSLIALCAFSPFVLYAKEAQHLYAGTLGQTPIVVELDLNLPTEVIGRYFYEKYHTDLALSGAMKGKELTLKEGLDDDSGKVLPVLHLRQTANAGFSGEWKGAKGKTLKVALKELHVPPPKASADAGWQAIYAQSPYDYLRLTQLPLQAGKTQNFMGHTLQWWTEPQSKVSMFEVTDGYPDEQRARINQQLRARLWDEVTSYHACLLQGSRFGGSFLQTVTPELLSPGIVSVSIFTSYDCGGAHPDFGDSPLNLDVNTGNPLQLEDVLWVGDGKAFHYDEHQTHNGQNPSDASFNTFSDYRSKHFAPWLVSQLQRFHGDDMKKPAADDEDNCDFSDPDIWNFPAWYLRPNGIYFGPSFARVMRSCESPDWSVVPYSVVKEHPGGVAVVLPE